MPTIPTYNDSNIPDDGSKTAANQIRLATIRTDLTDPLKDWIEANGFELGADITAASALGVNIPGLIHNVNGTTTITSLATITTAIPPLKILKFNGALTIEDSSAIELPGNANIATEANDVGIFYEYEAGEWRCISYVRNADQPIDYSSMPSITMTGDIDMGTTGNRIDLDTDNDSSIRASADDVITVEVGGSDVGGFYDGGVAGAEDVNLVINGDFNSWQEGTSFAAIAHTTRFADLWVYQEVGDAVHTLSRDTDVPTVAESGHLSNYSLKVDCTTVDSAVAAGDYVGLRYRMEGYDFTTIAQRPFTISFWHKHTKTGTYCIAARNSAGDRSYVGEYTQSVTNTWEKAEITVTASPSAGTWDYTTGTGLEFYFILMAGSTFHASAADAWETGNFLATSNQVNAADSTDNNCLFAQLKIEPGTQATPFKGRSHQAELDKIYRYFYRETSVSASIITSGLLQTTSVCICDLRWPQEMRAVPTLGYSNVADFDVLYRGNASIATAIAFAAGATTSGSRLDITGTGTPFTAGEAGCLRFDGAGKWWDLDARL